MMLALAYIDRWHHDVELIHDDPLITTGNGIIVIWENMRPRVVIHSVQVKSIITIRMPIFKYLVLCEFNIKDSIENCLVTLSIDHRIRLFDVLDGRCLSVSETLFDCRISALNKNNCRFLLLSTDNSIQLFDLWQLQTLKEYSLQCRAICAVNYHTFVVLDDQHLNIINFSPLAHDQYLDYALYIREKETRIKEFAAYRISDGLEKVQLPLLPSIKVIQVIYYEGNLIVLFKREVWCIFNLSEKQEYLQIHQSKNTHKFRALSIQKLYLFIHTDRAGVLPLRLKDIVFLNYTDDFVVGFREFQLTKQRVTRLQLNLQSIIPLYQTGKQNRVSVSDQIYQYTDIMRRYPLDFQLNINLFSDEPSIVKVGNLYLNMNCALIQIEDYVAQILPITTYVWDSPTTLLGILHRIWDPRIFDEFLPLLTAIQTVRVTSSYIEADVSNPTYWFGADNGMLYGFPMMCKEQMVIRIAKLDSKEIDFIYISDKLIAGSSTKLYIFPMTQPLPVNSKLEFQQLHDHHEISLPASVKNIVKVNNCCDQVLALQLQNFAVFILLDNSHMPLHGAQFKILTIYRDTLDNWITIDVKRNAHIYDHQGRLQRVFKVQGEFATERITTHDHDINAFRDEFNKCISEQLLYLEFSLRMNYKQFNSLETDPYAFDSIPSQRKYSNHRGSQVEWWDLKNKIQFQDDLNMQQRLFISIYPWGVDLTLDSQVKEFLGGWRQCFIGRICIFACDTLSIQYGNRWSQSQYVTTIQAMQLVNFYINNQHRDHRLVTDLMVRTINLLNVHQLKVDNFKMLSLPLLSTYAIDEQSEITTAALNLMISGVNKRVNNLQDIQKRVLSLLDRDPKHYSNVETMLLIQHVYIVRFGDGQPNEFILQRVLQSVDLSLSIINPHLLAALLKTIIDCFDAFKQIDASALLRALLLLFFNYNSVLDYQQSLRDNQVRQKILDEIARQPDELKKRMKGLLLKCIILLGETRFTEFTAVIREDILNLEKHFLYPCCIIDAIKGYIKSQSEKAFKQLPQLIDIILRSLDPNNPNLRRVCHQAATSALQTICKMFSCVAFHQMTQKIALGSADFTIIIYDLRTAVKWRVLDGHAGAISLLAFDQQGNRLASVSKTDQRLKIWKVASTGQFIREIRFFGSILGIQGKHIQQFNLKEVFTNISWDGDRVQLSEGKRIQQFNID